MRDPIYLDYNASTPVDPLVVERMLPYFSRHFGNPSSAGHAYGWAAAEAVDQAREQVAGLIEARPEEVVFTCGATEAVNLAVKGVAMAYAGKGRHIVTTRAEHKAVLESCERLERSGFQVTYVEVNPDGLVDPEVLAAAITDETILVSVIWANNETGAVNPMAELSGIVRSRGPLFMSDATQAVGKIPVSAAHVDLMALSGHKFYAPKGAGALYVRRRSPGVRLVPLIDGGGHENGMRSGTLNVPGIVGLGAAAEVAQQRMQADAERLSALRDRMEEALCRRLPGVRINGSVDHRLPNTTNLAFAGVRMADVLPRLKTLAVSTGSACQTGASKPSHVLKAIGLSDAEAFASIRFSLGRATTDEEIAFAIEEVIETISSVREKIPLADHFSPSDYA